MRNIEEDKFESREFEHGMWSEDAFSTWAWFEATQLNALTKGKGKIGKRNGQGTVKFGNNKQKQAETKTYRARRTNGHTQTNKPGDPHTGRQADRQTEKQRDKETETDTEWQREAERRERERER